MKYVGYFVACYVCLFVLVYLFQRKLCYAPGFKYGAPESDRMPEMETIALHTPDGLDLKSFFRAPKEGYPVILFFHGNTGKAEQFAHKLIPMADAGYGLMLLEYRGFGGNPGNISETGLILDAKTALDYIQKRQGEDVKVVYYGMSLGTGVANALAVDHPPFALIQECGFTSFPDVGKQVWWFLPVKYMMKDTYKSIDRIKTLTSPLLILHGEKDRVVYVSHAKKMYDAAIASKNKIIKLYPSAGHVDLYDFGSSRLILQWLNELIVPK